MQKFFARLIISVVVVVLAAAGVASARTDIELRSELDGQRAQLAQITSQLAALELQLQTTEEMLAKARQRYNKAHDAWKGLDYHFHNIDAGYYNDEASLVRVRVQEAQEEAMLAKLLGELGDAGQRRSVASGKLDQAKKYQLDPNKQLADLYRNAEKQFVAANDVYWKLHTEEALTRTRIAHWRNVSVQLEDKLAEADFVRLRDEVLKLRVRAQGLQREKKQAARLVAAIEELLK